VIFPFKTKPEYDNDTKDYEKESQDEEVKVLLMYVEFTHGA
jgi:hypothetical protein